MASIEQIKTRMDNIDYTIFERTGIQRTHEGFYIGGWSTMGCKTGISGESIFSTKDATDCSSYYIHVPFCDQSCNFCHFVYLNGANNDMKWSHLRDLEKEVQMQNRVLGRRQEARDIYIGGGTPSSLNKDQLRYLFDVIYSNIVVPDGTMVSVDAHPEIIREHGKLELLRGYANRIAIGGVDLNDDVLQCQQRGHNARDANDAIIQAKLLGFNVATDLIMGVPYQTPENWLKTLEILVKNEVDTIMTFPLMFKSCQANYRQYKHNPDFFPSIKSRDLMFMIAKEFLSEAGYTQGPAYYFNRDAMTINTQQVRKYHLENLIPLGISSFGFYNGWRIHNLPWLSKYHKAISEGSLPVWLARHLSAEELFLQELSFGLRLGSVDIHNLAQKHKTRIDLWDKLDQLSSNRLMKYENGILSITDIGELRREEIIFKLIPDSMKKTAAKAASGLSPAGMEQRLNWNMLGHKV